MEPTKTKKLNFKTQVYKTKEVQRKYSSSAWAHKTRTKKISKHKWRTAVQHSDTQIKKKKKKTACKREREKKIKEKKKKEWQCVGERG